VKSVRLIVSALALVVAIVGASTAPAFATGISRKCGTSIHDCCKAPIIKSCCSAQSDDANPGGPTESKVRFAPNVSATPVAVAGTMFLAITPVPRVLMIPPRAHPADLPILHSTLLI